MSLERGKQQETWNEACLGLNLLRRLIVRAPEVLSSQMRETVDATLTQIGNLRSSVSRLAILMMGDLFAELTRPMEKYIDKVIATLQKKVGAEASSFIREDVTRVLGVILYTANPIKSLGALLSSAESKNKDVRTIAVQFMCEAVGRIGDRVLDIRDADRLLKMMAQFVQDSAPEVRQHARRVLFLLVQLDNFDAIVAKTLTGTALRDMQAAAESLRKRGLDQTVRSGAAVGASTTRGRSSATRGAKTKSSAAVGGGSAAVKEIQEAFKQKDFRVRDEAIDQLVALAESKPALFLGDAVNAFFDFAPLLTDVNSKVNLHSIEALGRLVPALGSALEPVLPELMPALAHNFASKNGSIQSAANEAMATCCSCIEPASLIPALGTTMKKGNPVVQEALLPFVALAAEASAADAKACRQLSKHLVRTLVRASEDQRLAAQLGLVWQALYSALGQDLISHAAMTDKVRAMIN
ncbi:uncharacterized protein MONBRDRAFT_18189 [Monosiga brevicollis MX1]|uniref:TOG domain-containing protein n=1 Tax=Monosiga brevicollis TaxID=81824 RepID=A9UUU7_MONBE|nr:uncharacterized protein MONBRDRAFT_18189 [Monosiga brevicollis MX1]EDQ90968.1 predicted protein [Monosiga brevicollis MX1]|eukprot:XP_001744265.1 hypothetical protein [Monosiga brevicollis MX1]